MAVTVLNTTASLSGKTLLKAEDSQTITGLKSFDLGAAAPFGVIAGAAKVTNLDADKLDGQTGADYHDASLLTGSIAAASLGSGTPTAANFLRGDQSWAIAYGLNHTPGRLSLTTGVPVTITDVTAAGTLYYALYGDSRIALYTGTLWQLAEIAQLSVAAPVGANQVADVFVGWNGGTPNLTLTNWTNDTTRATALTTQNGVAVLTGDTTKRYVGTIRTVTASQINDSFALRHCWNYFNRVPRIMRVLEATNSWTYQTDVYRQANASAANQLDFVLGVAEEGIEMDLIAMASNDNSGVALSVAIGEDSTTVSDVSVQGRFANTPAANTVLQLSAKLRKYPAVGRHFYAWLEKSGATGTTTWFGDNNGVVLQSGISGVIRG